MSNVLINEFDGLCQTPVKGRAAARAQDVKVLCIAGNDLDVNDVCLRGFNIAVAA